MSVIEKFCNITLDTDTIAEYLETEYVGENVHVDGFEGLETAEVGDLSFCVYEDPAVIKATNAGIVIVPPSISTDQFGKTVIKSATPRVDFKRVLQKFFREQVEETVVHPAATVEDGSDIGDGCIIGPNVYIHENVSVGDNCTIQAGTVIGSVGAGYQRIESGALIDHIHKGSVVVEDDVTIGPNCAIDRAVFEETVVGTGTVIHSLTQVSHNVHIGKQAYIMVQCSLAGSLTLGDRVRLNPQACVGTRVTVGDDVEVGMNSTVLDDVEPDTTVVGSPARPI